jgi:signal transduction histidine kinase
METRRKSVLTILLNAQDDERRRISREIHDDLGPRIWEIGFHVRQIVAGTELPKSIVSKLHDVMNKTAELGNVIRNLSHQLHSPVLEIAGLAAGLRSLCRDFQGKLGIPIVFTSCSDLKNVPNEIALCLYRIAQESLNNIGKHSGARNASVQVSRTLRKIHLRISDSGIGFTLGSQTGNGLGLISMTERAQLLDGSLQIRTHPGGGTQVHVSLPLLRGRPSGARTGARAEAAT